MSMGGGTALFGGSRGGGTTASKALVEFRAGKMTTKSGKKKYV